MFNFEEEEINILEQDKTEEEIKELERKEIKDFNELFINLQKISSNKLIKS